MVNVIQVLGIAYLLIMLYLTFLYYKRNQYTLRNFLFWIGVWVLGVLLLLVPKTTSLLTQQLNVPRVIDFYLILGLMFFSVICFLSYAQVKRNEQKVEELVRKLALRKK
jgi:hypothetical protein